MDNSVGDANLGFPSKIESRIRWFVARPVLASGLVGIGYFFGARVGFALTFHPHPVSVMWLPNSILIAALLLMPVRIWWLPLLAALCAHIGAELLDGVPLRMMLCWFVSNSGEAVIGASLTRAATKGPVRFDGLRNLCVF